MRLRVWERDSHVGYVPSFAREFGPRNQIIKLVGMYISVCTWPAWLDGSQICWLFWKSAWQLSCRIEFKKIRSSHCFMFICSRWKKKPTPRRKSWLLFLRRKGKSEDHCRLSYITSRYLSSLVFIHAYHTQYVVFIIFVCMIIPIIYNFTIRPDTTICMYKYTMYCSSALEYKSRQESRGHPT